MNETLENVILYHDTGDGEQDPITIIMISWGYESPLCKIRTIVVGPVGSSGFVRLPWLFVSLSLSLSLAGYHKRAHNFWATRVALLPGTFSITAYNSVGQQCPPKFNRPTAREKVPTNGLAIPSFHRAVV